MATNVKARIKLNARVNVENATSGPKEGDQWHNIHECVTTCSLSEWNWRFAAAKAILCTGTTDYTSYGDAIGHGWV
jgi:hypothetical protein